MGFSGQEYWSGLPGPPPGDLPDPGIKAGSSALQADSLLPVCGTLSKSLGALLRLTPHPHNVRESRKSP